MELEGQTIPEGVLLGFQAVFSVLMVPDLGAAARLREAVSALLSDVEV